MVSVGDVMTTQSEVEKAVAQIYCAMLDNIALGEHRKYIQDLVTTGTAAMSFPNSIDERARHCAIHGCPHCKRFLSTSNPADRGTWIYAAGIAACIVAGVAVALLLNRWLQ